ncbi:MAG: hypothetical protein GXP55_15740, partial [Deltaproteobacteria bacterium]|nr:hypothetical protein [Deltaproteobacteria bacterium]
MTTSSSNLRDRFELLPDDPRWPAGLRDLTHGPELLHAHGELPDWRRAVSIVGTRRTDPEGLRFAEGLGHELAACGHVIVSGGAVGIDAAAHLGALAADGITVAVLASGLTP